MADDFRFIDSMGGIHDGRRCELWPDYLKFVPDYRVDISEVMVSGTTVVLLGIAGGTYSPDGTVNPDDYWTTPVALRAVVVDKKIKEWRVFADNEPIRIIMRKYNKL